ncbi:hypothetical protein B0H15DRAFT_1000961 [Mycena belliarum]|uniref:Ubiquitin-like protease family profile domain-containing protein n=1 Tax=Mycena belliarum TaxID=1033014 RepID=A0AAD6TSV7_9AGAR|nr:hypothetical protein B0H15DRAFT_1000961 [Mycena belliae]
MADWVDSDPLPLPSSPSLPRDPTGGSAQRLTDAWNHILPQLEAPWLGYYERTHGKPREVIPVTLQYSCIASCASSTISKVKCLYPTRHLNQFFRYPACHGDHLCCKPAAVLLLEHGVFPASPTKTKTGVSIDVLDFYPLAAALHTLYDRRGFRVTSDQAKDERASDPFRRLLIQAVQWAANLRDRVEKRVAAALVQAEARLTVPAPEAPGSASTTAFVTSTTAFVTPATAFVTPATAFVASATPSATGPPVQDAPPPGAAGPSVASAAPDGGAASARGPPPLKRGQADRILRERCPACFNLQEWGRDLKEGGDVQVGADGCFSYRHMRKAGDGPISYDPSFFIPKHKVDAVAQKIDVARKRPAAKVKPFMPQEVIDACQESWDAANENKRKADPKRYDASGIFVMTCRHGQVLFLCNVDTPGEQQRYIIAMVEEVASLLPPSATVVQAYDVGCVTDHSLNLADIVCNKCPRFREGMGLADHEGVERFWSRIRKLIPLTRGQWNSRRIWMIDQYAAFVSAEGREGLGNWIHRQQRKNVTPRHRAATATLLECRVPVQELRVQWEAQKLAQTSIRAHAPARLRRELDKVLLLQNQIDAVEKAIDDTKKTLQGSKVTHARLGKEAEDLYTSLNIQETFPELRGLPLEFAQTLLVMRDLKINIRKRAIGSFFEWETLDRAVSGRREALGTKLHQSTRKAISKRQPSLLKAIKKFNAGCESLARLRPADCNVPIPSPLSTQLNGLRNDPDLHEDVWITPSVGPIPRWLNDEDVRDGIRSLHVADRCAEEVIRLNLERDNLRRWLLEEMDVVRRAIELNPESPLVFLLRWREDHITELGRSWGPSLRLQDVNSRFVTQSAASATAFATSATTFATSTTTFATSATTFATSATTFAASTATSTSSFPLADDLFGEGGGGDGDADMGAAAYELDPGALSDEDQANLIEEVLQDSDEEEEEGESSTVEALADSLDVQWEYTMAGDVDTTLISDLATHNASLYVIEGDLSHFVVRPGHRALQIALEDWQPFQCPTGRLNGFGLNGVAASLQRLYSDPYSPTKAFAEQCAVLSTYDLPCVRYKGSDPDLWRRVEHTRYWEKPVWLIPIHRPTEEHWVLVVVIVPRQELFFFDSMASRGGWRRDLRDVMVLVTRMVVLSNRNQHPLHVATEGSSTPDQWIRLRPLGLCMMAAIMRGRRDIQLSEAEMPWVRGVLRDHIQTLPIS